MPFIEIIPDKEETSPIQDLYKDIQNTMGHNKVPNAFKVTSLNYGVANWMWQGFKTIMLKESEIPRSLKESIALVVSKNNSCKYCAQAHSFALKMLGFDDKKIEEISNNQSIKSEKEKIVFDFVLKITNEAYKITEKDHENLKRRGFTQKQILEIISVASYFNLINRLVDSLGAELEF